MSRERQSTQRKNQGYSTYQGKKAPMNNNQRKAANQQYQGMSGNVTLLCVAVGLLMGLIHAGYITGAWISMTSTFVAASMIVAAYHLGRLGK